MADVHYIFLGRSQREFSIGGHCSLGYIDLQIKTKSLYDYYVQYIVLTVSSKKIIENMLSLYRIDLPPP